MDDGEQVRPRGGGRIGDSKKFCESEVVTGEDGEVLVGI